MEDVGVERVQQVVMHMLNLQREGQGQQLMQMMDAAQNLGVTVDLHSKRWLMGDGRMGNTEPFSVDPPEERGENASGQGDGSPGLPPPRTALTPVSLAQVMKEQQSGKEGSPAAAGIANPRGEYNCFLNVVIQTLWHVPSFRDAILSVDSSDELAIALQQVAPSVLTLDYPCLVGRWRCHFSSWQICRQCQAVPASHPRLFLCSADIRRPLGDGGRR
jgi:hypothetical protein